jgi:tetratricopeptide (TPR) repeat protein
VQIDAAMSQSASSHSDHRLGGAAVLLVAAVSAIGCHRLTANDSSEGVRLYQQGNYLGAVNSFQRALDQQPGNPDCFYNLGATYHQQAKLFSRPGDLETAEQYYHLCLARAPDHAACQRGLAVLLVETGRSDEAIDQLEQWAVQDPDSPEPHIEIARLCQEQGNLPAAEEQLAAALAVDPDNSRALVAQGQMREAAGDTQQALASYSRALELDRNQPTVMVKVATLQDEAAAATVAARPPPTGVLPTAR